MPLPSFIPAQQGITQSLGEALGTGLGSGIQALTNMKLQEMQLRQQQTQVQKALQNVPGMTPDVATAIAGMPPQLQQAYIHEYLAAPREEAYAKSIQNMMNQLTGQPIQQEQPKTSQFMQQPPQVPKEQVVGPYTPYNVQPQQMVQPIAQPQQMPQVQLPGRLNAQQATQIANLAMGAQKLGLQQRAEARKEKEFTEKQIGESYQNQRKTIDQMHVAGRAAKQEIANLRNVLTLYKGGNLNIGKNYAALQAAGLENFFSTPTTNIVSNYLAQSAQAATSDYGTNRLTNTIMKFESMSVPALWNTPEGFEANVKNRILRREPASLRDDEVKKIIAEAEKSHKPLPRDVVAEAERRIYPKTKKIAEKELLNNIEAMEKTGSSPLPKGKEDDEGFLPDVPDVKWTFHNGKWHPEIIAGEEL